MAESGLSVGLPDLRKEVAFFLGYGRDDTAWSTDQTTEMDDYIQSGVRQFYYPHASEIVDPSFEWSFLRPTTTIDTVADDWEYDFPDDFGRMIGQLHFASTVGERSIPFVSYGSILAHRSKSTDSGVPRIAATRWKTSDGTTGQRQELVLYPTPDDAYTLTYQYEAFNGKLTETYPYPLGGMKHAETIISSCLAVAELRANGERGPHAESFERNLATSVQRDRKSGAKVFGHMGDPGGFTYHGRAERCLESSYAITYKGDTL